MRSMCFEDNEDNTITATVKSGDEEMTFLIPFGFDQLQEMFGQLTIETATDIATEQMILIPNSLE